VPVTASGRPARHRRVEADRSIAAILEAAPGVFGERPDASVEDVARAAGVSRQTIYAHYSSREALLDAVLQRAAAEVDAMLDAADLDAAPPSVALVRLIEVGWEVTRRYPFLWRLPAVGPEEDRERHGPLFERFERLIRRGQKSGEFDRQLSPEWLVAGMLALANAAGEEVRTGRMPIAEAEHAVQHSVLRLFGVERVAAR
jgi:AcrR family transcriptional regulator